jgi:hypothetical protein
MKPRTIRVTLLLLAVSLAIFITVRVRLSRNRAEAFLRETGRLAVGKTSFRDAEAVLAPYRHHVSYSDRCTPEHCLILFVFKNTWLRILHLAPAASFGGTLVFENDVLVARITLLGQGECCAGHVTESTSFAEPADPAHPDFSVMLERDKTGHPQKAMVELTPRASVEQRQEAYDVNLDCLSRVGGCKAEELMPSLWSRSGPSPRYFSK